MHGRCIFQEANGVGVDAQGPLGLSRRSSALLVEDGLEDLLLGDNLHHHNCNDEDTEILQQLLLLLLLELLETPLLSVLERLVPHPRSLFITNMNMGLEKRRQKDS